MSDSDATSEPRSAIALLVRRELNSVQGGVFHIPASTAKRRSMKDTNTTIAILSIVFGGLVGLIGPIIAAAFAARRQTQQLRDERERLQITLTSDRTKTVLEEQRKLLDQGAVLLVEIDEGLSRISRAALSTDARSEQDEQWEQSTRELERFRARLTLWFDERSDVVESFSNVLNKLTHQRTTVAGRLAADDELRKSLVQCADDPSVDEKVQELDAQRKAIYVEAATEVEQARKRYLRAARGYLATQVPATDLELIDGAHQSPEPASAQ